jgi:hypothetical protein
MVTARVLSLAASPLWPEPDFTATAHFTRRAICAPRTVFSFMQSGR